MRGPSGAALLPVKEWAELVAVKQEPEEGELVAVKREPEEIPHRGVIGPEDYVGDDVEAVAAAIAAQSLREEEEHRRRDEEIEDLGVNSIVSSSHRHEPCTLVLSKERSFSKRLHHDVPRASYVQQDAGGYGLHQSDVSMLPLLGDALGSIEYVVTIGIGLPAFGQTIGIDTGKHVSWYASHTLALTGSKAIKGFQFIYSHTDAFNPRLNGLVKIGSGVQSFVSHKAATYGSQFSYCLPSTPSPSGSSP
ncbi:uncharacterized protein [Aegilops tauschii subsp. strangulata]|uniref:uncharacterized protein n=1 Tax=Aegilops tauschii subsp. strangulata TaxID=200361 RepID=UPI00098AAB06|nr:uncharacterized protein LOC109761613 [Aegilops tauschii subsp. strangulata]